MDQSRLSEQQEVELRELIAQGKVDAAMRRYCKLTQHTMAQAALWARDMASTLLPSATRASD